MSEVSHEEFVKAWLKAYKDRTGLKELAKTLGMQYSETSARASNLRRAGVKLPTMPHKNQQINYLETDVPKLNGIIVSELGEESMDWRTR